METRYIDSFAIKGINTILSVALTATTLLTILFWGAVFLNSPMVELIFGVENPLISGGIGLLIMFVLAICKWLLNHDYQQASILIFVFFTISIPIITYIFLKSGIYDPITHVFYLALVITALFLNRRYLYIITAIGIFFNFIFYYLVLYDITTTIHIKPTFDDVIIDSTILLLTTIIIDIITHQIDFSRNRLIAYQNDLEGLVAERTEQLHLERDRAEAASLAKSQFLANMSHELRTPLNAIIGYSELLQETIDEFQIEVPAAEIDSDIQKIESSGRHLLRLINNLLDLSKIDAGRMSLEMGYHDLDRIIREVSFALKPQAVTKGLTFHIEIDQERFENRPLFLDKLKTEQVLINLLANAIKFTEQGKVSLHVTASGEPEKMTLQFEISDTGIGIEPEFIPKLFNRFDQGNNSELGQYTGTGLGLAISKQLIDLMHGEISVQSEKGKGTTFKVYIPTHTISLNT